MYVQLSTCICRIVVLPSGAFDSKTKFLQELRKKYGGGTFNFGSTISGVQYKHSRKT